ncbi:hypothetical protein [Pseudomonas kilonensis]|uniref:CDI immunity protein domain-containing protein n=1 Tax=Pseudomonas kilonensis TaxID=132476 RepID=A0ABY0Z6D0_9PSED|nr:hypothetical protein [Pseudomonas kilonensis]SEE35858.1 hypothetical protein SAMN04490188_3530 [Pseudomonas kilonensis]
MKWGELPGDDRDLLFWVLWFAIEYYSDYDLNKFFERFFTLHGGLMGDPGWEFECLKDESGREFYEFSADHNFSGIEPECRSYDVSVVREAVKSSLLALAYKDPMKVGEVADLLAKYEL